jgi:uncharacterized protein (TIGR00369 family)
MSAKPSREEVAARLTRSPYHQWLGLELASLDGEWIEIRMPWRDEVVSRNDPVPLVHGGVLAALIDLAGLQAVYAQGGKPNGTAYMHVDYHRPATRPPFTVRARPLKLGKSLSTAEAFVHDAEGQLVASGRGGYPTGS